MNAICENGKVCPKLSIITAVYNGADKVEACIKSIVNQTFSDWEYIVVDGGSEDGTIDIIEKYRDRIRVFISEKDKGIYDALNKGLEVARGEWVYIIGSDDRLYDHETLASVFSNRYDSNFIYGNVLCDENCEVVGKEFLVDDFYEKNICQQAIFYKRELFHKLGKFNTKYKILADWVFNMKAYRSPNTKPIYINTVVAIYSLGGISSRELDRQFILDRDRLFIEAFGFLRFVKVRFFAVLSSIFKDFIR